METYELNSKQVLYVGSPELCTNYLWEKKSEYLNPRIGVVSVESLSSEKDKGIEIITRNNAPIYEGLVLVNHPFKKNCFMDVTMAEDELFRQKLDAIVLVARHLGVKSFKAQAKFENSRHYEFEADGDVKVGKFVNLDATYKHQEEEKRAMQYSREENFTGGFDMKGYEEAKRLANQFNLSEINSIIELRNPNFSNRLGCRKETLELSKELNDITECAFSLNILAGVFKLGGSLKETISIQKKVSLMTELNFE